MYRPLLPAGAEAYATTPSECEFTWLPANGHAVGLLNHKVIGYAGLTPAEKICLQTCSGFLALLSVVHPQLTNFLDQARG